MSAYLPYVPHPLIVAAVIVWLLSGIVVLARQSVGFRRDLYALGKDRHRARKRRRKVD
jgi:hypothetical protein